MLDSLSDPLFWSGLGQIILINIVLSGDNAVVIALAARSLPARQQRQAIFWGSGAAVVLRIILTVVAVELLRLAYLKIVGGLLLLWVAVQLLLPEDEAEGHAEKTSGLLSAVRTILIADLVMSLDNVIAVAAAARGDVLLLIIGLALSIPLVIFGSTLLLKLMERFPIIITLGAALLGWVAGEMFVTDPAVKEWVEANAAVLHWVVPGAGAAAVVALGTWLSARLVAKRARLTELGKAPVAVSVAAPSGAQPGMFNRLLVAADASDNAARAVEYAIAIRRYHPAPETVDIRLLNVQREMPGDVSRFVDKESVDDYRRENAEKALARPRRLLEAAGATYSVHVLVGEPSEVISDYAGANLVDLIVMGTRGLGALAGGLLGSVAQGVAARSTVPVLLVK